MPTESCKARFSDSTWHPRNEPAPANSLDSGLNSNDNNDPFRDNSLSQPRGAGEGPGTTLRWPRASNKAGGALRGDPLTTTLSVDLRRG